MSSLIPLDRVVDLVKNLIDGIRCPICDKYTGDRFRYFCGHTGCDDCLTSAEGCMLCLTPLNSLSLNKIADKPLTDRTKSVNKLVHACEKTFNVNVFNRNRISTQLRLEKELFPECIQAPHKYCNKRKSSTSFCNKENTYPLPGEQITPSKQFKMKRRNSSIQNWLNVNEPFSRKVFSELDVNRQSFRNTSKKVSQSILSTRKRKPSFTSVKKVEEFAIESKRNKKSLLEKKSFWESEKNKHDHEESGIVLDDEPIYIDDSQTEKLDKDELALLAVQQAENECLDSTSEKSIEQSKDLISKSNTECHGKIKLFNDDYVKVPFYRRSSLIDNYAYIADLKHINKATSTDSKNISISIENKNFITTIKISNCNENKQVKAQSITVQTDICDANNFDKNNYGIKENEHIIRKENVASVKDQINAFNSNGVVVDSVVDDCKIKLHPINNEHVPANTLKSKELEKKEIVIDDSDSDSTSEELSFLHVSADVHVSCEPQDYGILCEKSCEQVKCKSKTKGRGATPDSSNSSEKENCDPNKIKKRKEKKKIETTKNKKSQ